MHITNSWSSYKTSNRLLYVKEDVLLRQRQFDNHEAHTHCEFTIEAEQFIASDSGSSTCLCTEFLPEIIERGHKHGPE